MEHYYLNGLIEMICVFFREDFEMLIDQEVKMDVTENQCLSLSMRKENILL